MADYLNEFVASLLGGDTQKAIAAQNPYTQIQQAPDLLSSLALQAVSKSPGKYSTGEAIGLALGGGLASGILGNLGQSYQSDLTNKYLDAISGTGNLEDLPSGLFGQAKLQQKLFQLNNAQKAVELQNEITKAEKLGSISAKNELGKTIISEMMKNPYQAKRAIAENPELFAQILGGEATTPTAKKIDTAGEKLAVATGAPIPQAGEDTGLGRGVEGTLLDEVVNEADRLRRRGFSDEQAIITARQAYTEKREQLGRQYKRIEDADKFAGELRSLADTASISMQDVGYTGTGGEAAQALSGALSVLPWADENEKKFSAGQKLESLAPSVVTLLGKGFTGPKSDKDIKILLSAGPSLSKTPEANQDIINKWNYVANLEQQYADFMREKQDAGVSVSKAEGEWQKIKRDNPYVIKTKSGRLEINPAWQDGTVLEKKPVGEDAEADISGLLADLDGGGGAGGEPSPTEAQAPETLVGATANDPNFASKLWGTAKLLAQGPKGAWELYTGKTPVQDLGFLGGKAVEGVTEVPQLVKDLFSKKTYQEAFKTPEQSARTIGKGAAMTAGALKGGALGAAGGTAIFPGVGTAIGGGLGAAAGAGAGYLGYDAAEEGLSELAGVGTDKPVIPTREMVGEAAKVGGQTLALGAAAKVAGGATKITSGAVKAVANKLKAAIPGAEQELMGVRPANIEKAIKEGKIKYFDESGKETLASDAAEFQTAVDQSIQIAKADGFLKQVGNDPKTLVPALRNKLVQTGDAIKELHTEASEALSAMYEKLSPAQKAQFKLTRDPKTGKGGFLAPSKEANPFSSVMEKISEISRTEPALGKTLRARAEAVISRWNKSPRAYETLQTYKASFGGATKWKPGATEVADAWNQIKGEFYKTFSDTQAKAFEFAMQETNPQKVTALKQANALYHAYSNLAPIISKTASKGTPPLEIGVLATPKSLLAKAPKTVLSAKEGLASGASGLASSADALSQAFNNLLNGTVPPAAGVAPVFGAESKKKSMTKQSSADVDALYEAQDPLVKAMIMQESSKNPEAVSPVGAVGLMQLMPKTAKEVAKDLGIETYDLRDPNTNITFGKHYFEKKKKEMGSVPLALAAYNAGAKTIKDALELLGRTGPFEIQKEMELGVRHYMVNEGMGLEEAKKQVGVDIINKHGLSILSPYVPEKTKKQTFAYVENILKNATQV